MMATTTSASLRRFPYGIRPHNTWLPFSADEVKAVDICQTLRGINELRMSAKVLHPLSYETVVSVRSDLSMGVKISQTYLERDHCKRINVYGLSVVPGWKASVCAENL